MRRLPEATKRRDWEGSAVPFSEGDIDTVKTHILTFVLAVLLVGLGSSLQSASLHADGGVLDAYVLTVNATELMQLQSEARDLGYISKVKGGYEVEVVLSPTERKALVDRGLMPELFTYENGLSIAQQAELNQEEGYDVYRSWDEEGGIRDELYQIAEENPGFVALKVLGTTHQGREIIALKVTNEAAFVPDGSRPAILYSSLQHAREWIAIETNRRLLHYFVDNYGKDAALTELIDENEFWFVICANPDGYQYTFEGQRLWRKNMADNDGDGVITNADGVDPNRNFEGHWNYDVNGSSSNPGSGTYRGPDAASEPETKNSVSMFFTAVISASRSV